MLKSLRSLQFLYLCKVVLPLFHKHEAKIDTLASSAQVTNDFFVQGRGKELVFLELLRRGFQGPKQKSDKKVLGVGGWGWGHWFRNNS